MEAKIDAERDREHLTTATSLSFDCSLAHARESETGREEETEGGKAFAQSKEIDTKKARASERQSAIYRQTISLLRFDCVYVLLICVCVCVYECELCAY